MPGHFGEEGPLAAVARVSAAMQALIFQEARSGPDDGMRPDRDLVPIWLAADGDPSLTGPRPVPPWRFLEQHPRLIRAMDDSGPVGFLVDGRAALLYAQAVDDRIRVAAREEAGRRELA